MKVNSDWSDFRQTLSERKQHINEPPSAEVVEIRLRAVRAVQLMEELRDFFRPFAEGEERVGTW